MQPQDPQSPWQQPTQNTTINPGKNMGIAGFIVQFFFGLPGLIIGIFALHKSKKAGQSNIFALLAIILGSLRTIFELVLFSILISLVVQGGVSSTFDDTANGRAGYSTTDGVACLEKLPGVLSARITIKAGSVPLATGDLYTSVYASDTSTDTLVSLVPKIAQCLVNDPGLPSVATYLSVYQWSGTEEASKIVSTLDVKDRLGLGDYTSDTLIFTRNELEGLAE